MELSTNQLSSKYGISWGKVKYIVDKFNVQPDATSARGRPAYDVDKFEEFLTKHKEDTKRRNKRDPSEPVINGDKEVAEMELLLEKIRKWKLDNDEREKKLLDTQSVFDYLISVHTKLNMVVKNILLVRYPNMGSGKEPQQLRVIGEKLYNEFISLAKQGVEEWKRQYPVEGSTNIDPPDDNTAQLELNI